ncbi:MAG: MarR family transcriptional regulator [Bacillota bacterium]
MSSIPELRHAGEEGLPLCQLGEKLLVTRANITGLIDRLEKDGLVIREADVSDRRVIRARLTRQAQNKLDAVLPLHGAFTGMALESLDLPEKEQLLALLQKLQAGLKKW